MTDNQSSWIQIRVKCSVTDLDTVSGIMSMVDNGLMIEDYSDVDQELDGVYGDLIDESIIEADRTVAYVSVFIPEIKSPAESVVFIRSRLKELAIDAEVTQIGVSEEDWADSWKKYYKPIKTGKQLVIVPVWEEYTPAEGEITVLMDPGMAFGTGTHETTRLCAAMLEKYTKPGCKVLDVGCGSGILAICASKLGAAECFACDIDPQAVKVAVENTELNHTANVKCAVSDLLKQVEGSGYDVVVANIVADIIIRLSPDVGAYMAKDGVCIVSGIIEERAEEVVEALHANGFEICDESRENGWYCACVKQK
ncbi:MAG: 50S ribosomal protein L11 methyltransferase [Clostridia bacterium]|nr:50S ribosomal protein L11 methyltransferase [Clostridia bacterium]